MIVTPVSHHVPVRELRERRTIALPEPPGTIDDSPGTSSQLDDATELIPPPE